MIADMVTHDGDPKLVNHLALADENESVSFRMHGLSATTIADAIAEMKMMAFGTKTDKPLFHSWFSPSIEYSEKQWRANRDAFEEEFGLQGFPCVEAFHRKFGAGGRTSTHVHRVYLRIRIDGVVVGDHNSTARQHKVSRISEYLNGERFVRSPFNRSIIERLRKDGRTDIADAMIRVGMHLRQLDMATAPSSEERAMTKRLHDLAPDEAWRRAFEAWRCSDNGVALQAALLNAGLRLAEGGRCPVIVTAMGAIYPLLRAINKGGARISGKSIRKADLDARIKGLTLPAASDLKPIDGVVVGPFEIVGLDRTTPAVAILDQQPVMDDGYAPVEQVAPVHTAMPSMSEPTRVPALSDAQLQALLELDAAFADGAAAMAAAKRADIEARVKRETIEERERLAARVRSEFSAWGRPAIGVPGWKSRFKSELAGLPDDVGALMQWVDRLQDGRKRVVLHSGTIVTLGQEHARCDVASADTIEVMIAHATAMNWTEVTVSGGTAEWREHIARAATRAGVKVINEGLQTVVLDDLRRQQKADLLDRWHFLRQKLAAAHTAGQRVPELRQQWRNLFANLVLHPGIEDDLQTEKLRALFMRDLSRYHDFVLTTVAKEQPTSDPVGPGL